MTVDFHAGDKIFGRMVGPQGFIRRLQTEQLGRCGAGLQPDDGLRRMERHRLRVPCRLKTGGAKSDEDDFDEMTVHICSEARNRECVTGAPREITITIAARSA